MVISRAGANAICEISALHKPNLLIPLSANASRGDQILNARSFEKQGFSMVLEEEEITDEKLLDTIHQLYDNRHSFEEAMSAGKQMDSIHHIVSLIEECVLSKNNNSRMQAVIDVTACISFPFLQLSRLSTADSCYLHYSV